MGEAMNNNGTDLFEGTLDALDGITEGTGLNVKPVERGGFNPPLSFNEQLDEILDYLLEPNTDDETPEGTIRNYRTLVLHDSEFQVRQAEAKQAIKQLIASELGAIIDANIDPDHAIDTDRVYEALVEWIGELQGGGDE